VSARTPEHVHENEGAALMQASRDWAAAAGSGDVERILSYWAEDAIVLPPDRPALIGKPAIREFVRQSLAAPGFSITWEPEAATVAPAGDLGYLVERNRLTFVDGSGNVATQHGKGVTIWRKDPTAGWKCVIDIWNASPTERVLIGP
jgi:ketosteroid isomerase-like protein